MFNVNNNTSAILRVIDANINRTQEALRVVEDAIRFVLEDACLTHACKRLRHDLATWATQFKTNDLLAMRSASGDIGHNTSLSTEYQRNSLADVARANLSRAGQSLRTLEEFSKTLNSEAAIAAEKIRYKVYDLEKALFLLIEHQDRMKDVRLYVLVDSCDHDVQAFESRITALCENGADALQLRDKSLSDRQLIQFGKRLVAIARKHQVVTVINDRVDVAMSVGADGVHLGQDDMPLHLARQQMGTGMLIGLSTHGLEQVRQAVLDGASYIGLGPTFASTTKHFDEFTGLPLLEEAMAEITLPAFAIGGITLDNLPDVLECGIQRVAVSGAVPDDPAQAARAVQEFRRKLLARVEVSS